MAANLGVTSAHLRQIHPELAALARTAAQEQLSRLSEEKRRQRCARIQEVAASLVAQGERLTIARVRQEVNLYGAGFSRGYDNTIYARNLIAMARTLGYPEPGLDEINAVLRFLREALKKKC
jgi:hypothetical protein